MFFHRFDESDHAAVDLLADVYEFFHLEPAGKQFFLQLFGGNIDIHIIL